MKKTILTTTLGFLIATALMTATTISIAHADEREKLAKIGKSCEKSSDYQSCVASQFFKSIN